MRQDQLFQHGQSATSDEEEIARDARARQLQAFRLRVALFKGLQVESPEERQAALDRILQVVTFYLRSAESSSAPSPAEPATPVTSATPPTLADRHHHQDKSSSITSLSPSATHLAESDHALSHDSQAGGTEEQLHYLLLTMLRLAHTCPFRHVRQTFKAFLQKADARSPSSLHPTHLSPSAYIHLQDIFSLESTTSNRAFIAYPRSSRLSFSPWSQDGESSDGGGGTSEDVTEKVRSEDGIEEAASTGGRPSDEYVRLMMVKSFLEEGRLSNMLRIMSFFPTFYEAFNRSYKCLIKGSVGPLDRAWKCYMGIMVSAELKCQYLVSMLKLEFLQNGGDPMWLRGLDYCPRKLQHICPLILKMSRQPWRLCPEDLTRLMSTSNRPIGESWTKSELVQAIVVVATFLSLGSFVLGCGVVPEMDMRGGFSGARHGRVDGVEYELDLHPPVWSPRSDISADTAVALAAASSATGWYDSSVGFSDDINSQDQEQSHQRQVQQAFSSDNGAGLGVTVDEQDTDDGEDKEDQDDTNSSIGQPEYIQETEELITKLQSNKNSEVDKELKQSLEMLYLERNKAVESLPSHQKSHDLSFPEASPDEGPWAFDDFSLFIDSQYDKEIPVERFQEGQDGYELFMLGDYCWEDHGSALVNQFMPNLGEYLDEELEEALSITDWSIFHQVSDTAVDTLPLRNAIWHYTQKLFGMIQEDYPYDDIDIYLSDVNKEYIAKVCQRPFQIRNSDWNNIGISLRPEEKCHVNLLIASSKKQALLCRGLYVASII